MDTVSALVRSKIMSRVRSEDTKPEILVRRLVHSMGFRYRLHVKDLPGRPDLVFPAKRKVIFVHGCFWHGHNCEAGTLPQSNVDYWSVKQARNMARDRQSLRSLARDGWKTLVIWECKLRVVDRVSRRVRKFLNGTR